MLRFWPYAHRVCMFLTSFLSFRLFPVFDFGLAHYASEPYNYYNPLPTNDTHSIMVSP